MVERNLDYKYEISAEILIEAFSISDEEFYENEDFYENFGIERLSAEELKKKYPSISFFGRSDHLKNYTCIQSSDIKPSDEDTLYVKGLDKKVFSNIFFDNCQLPDIEISDCKFNSSEKNESITPSINFVNSHVGDLAIDNSIFEELFLENSTVKEIRTRKSAIKAIKINESRTKDIEFWDGSRIGESIFNKSTIGRFGISFSKTGKFEIIKTTTGRFGIFQSTIGGFNMGEATIDSFNFSMSKVGNFSCRSTSIKRITTSAPKAETDYFENLGFFSSNIELIDIEVLGGNLTISSSSITKLILSSCRLKEMKIDDGCEVNIFVKESSINYLNLEKLNVSYNSSISLSDSKLYACSLEELNNLGKIFFRKVRAIDPKKIEEYASKNNNYVKYHQHLSSLYREHFPGYPYFSKSTFRIYYSSLGKIEFIDSDLNSFKSFEFNNSRITELFISGGSMPQNISIYGSKKGSKEWFDQMVSWFNQLSTIFQAQGNVYQSVDCRSKSASFKHELLKKTKFSRRSFFDRLAFSANKISNDYGADWAKASWFIIWSSVLLYFLILCTTGNLFRMNMQFDPDFIGYYFDFLNPLRPFDFFNEIGINVNWGTKLIDLLSRIVISYGIYQLVTAFRRYGRK